MYVFAKLVNDYFETESNETLFLISIISFLLVLSIEILFFVIDFEVDSKYLYIIPRPFGIFIRNRKIKISDIVGYYITKEKPQKNFWNRSVWDDVLAFFVRVKMKNSKRKLVVCAKSYPEAIRIKKAISKYRF